MLQINLSSYQFDLCLYTYINNYVMLPVHMYAYVCHVYRYTYVSQHVDVDSNLFEILLKMMHTINSMSERFYYF